MAHPNEVTLDISLAPNPLTPVYKKLHFLILHIALNIKICATIGYNISNGASLWNVEGHNSIQLVLCSLLSIPISERYFNKKLKRKT